MEITPIGHISSPYKQKFAIPRQPGLVKGALGEIVFTKEFADPNCMRGLDQFSHLWLLFRFHETADKGWTPLVQPPRLGGREKVGVFASRSTFRPNGLGQSVVENLGWHQQGSKLVLQVGGIDLLEGTPIIDIKPYIPYADSISGAVAGYAEDAPDTALSVEFDENAAESINELGKSYPNLEEFITEILRQDPRPAWRPRETDKKQYGMTLYDLNIKWRICANLIRVLSVTRL